MSQAESIETRGFQAEVKQLLHLMIHSLYSNKEIFLRELISNASDACDKLRFQALADDSLYGDDPQLCIRVEADKTARTITITDNGIGMSRDEVIENIGTIARSGTRSFLEKLTGDQAKDARLIGQFGVGFYSAFIVADKVTLTTRRADLSADQAVRWSSDGAGEYTLENVSRAPRGTEVVLHLKAEEDGFLEPWQLRSIITRYSDHIGIPVQLKTERPSELENAPPVAEWEQVNQATALWARPRNEITDDEYQEFYKHVAHDMEAPLTWTHNRVEGRQEYTALLYLPKNPPFDLWDRDRRHGIKLYVQRVFIMDDAEHLMPGYLRFVRGVIDSNDLPLNVSREILQGNRIVDGIRAGCVKKVLGLLEDLAKDKPEDYQAFWNAFGRVLKEGPGEDFANRDTLAKLLRFASTQSDDAAQTVSLSDYVARMKPGQDKIYYITADSHQGAKNSPHLEIFRKKGVEVLLLSDRVDEWLVAHLNEFDGKSLASVAKGGVSLEGIGADDDDSQSADKPDEKALEPLMKRIKDVLGDSVGEVRISQRLTDSPACLVADEHALSGHLERLLKDAGQSVPATSRHLELNPGHALVKRLEVEADGKRFEDWCHLLYDQAWLAEGGQLEDPSQFVRRLNGVLLDLAG